MFYPAHLNLQNRKCLVVGAGAVAERKVLSLLRSGGDVTLISPKSTKRMEILAQRGRMDWCNRRFQPGDTKGMFLVCAATDNPAVNRQVFQEAREIDGINLVNVVDVVSECTFAAASVVTHNDLTISISTGGKSPAMSRRIREYLETKFDAESLYEEPEPGVLLSPPTDQGFPYPVYLLLENRRCAVITDSEALDSRIELLQRCGASVERISPAADHLPDVFLVMIEEIKCRNSDFASVLNSIQLLECLDAPERGTFITPLLVMAGDLIIGISTSHGQTEKEQNRLERVTDELARQFENRGYGAFIDFLGCLRPLAMEAIPTQAGRQRFFDDLIDQIPGDKVQRCCLGFDNIACPVECTFNLVRWGQFEQAYQWANERLGKLTVERGMVHFPHELS